MDIIIGTQEINKVKCIIAANTYGDFRIYIDENGERGQHIGYADKLDAAVAKARTELNKRKVKIKVPFITETGEPGFCSGLHGGNGNLMINIGGKKSQEAGRVNRSKFFDPETPKDVLKKLSDHRNAVADAQNSIRQIEKEWVINLGDLVKAEIDAKVAAKEAKS